MNCGISMASVIAETEEKIKVMRHAALLTSTPLHMSVTWQESYPWNVTFDNLSAPSSWLCMYWPGSQHPGPVAWQWFLPFLPSLGAGGCCHWPWHCWEGFAMWWNLNCPQCFLEAGGEPCGEQLGIIPEFCQGRQRQSSPNKSQWGCGVLYLELIYYQWNPCSSDVERVGSVVYQLWLFSQTHEVLQSPHPNSCRNTEWGRPSYSYFRMVKMRVRKGPELAQAPPAKTAADPEPEWLASFWLLPIPYFPVL